jgi:cytochrome P450
VWASARAQIFGPGVVYDAPLPVRRQQFKLLANSLRTDALKSYVPKVIRESEQFYNEWGKSGAVDVRDAMSELIIRTASSALMGDEVRNHLHAQVSRIFQTLDEAHADLFFFFFHFYFVFSWI